MGYESNFTEKIYDNVYGFIYLTKEEKELLSTPYFQRLNHIRQLGLAYFVLRFQVVQVVLVHLG